MNIIEFKQGDIITRSERTESIGDGSYIGDKLKFVGLENNIIVFVHLEGVFKGDTHKLYSGDWSEGWSYYPQKLIDKAKEFGRKIKTNKTTRAC